MRETRVKGKARKDEIITIRFYFLSAAISFLGTRYSIESISLGSFIPASIATALSPCLQHSSGVSFSFFYFFNKVYDNPPLQLYDCFSPFH